MLLRVMPLPHLKRLHNVAERLKVIPTPTIYPLSGTTQHYRASYPLGHYAMTSPTSPKDAAMTYRSTLAPVCMLMLLFAATLFSQQQPSDDSTAVKDIRIDAVVTDKSLKGLHNIPMDSFKVLDNGVERKLTSFKEFSGKDNPVTVLIVVDAVNTPFSALAYQREQIVKYFSANGGRLEHPTTFAVLTDKGIQVFNKPSKDGTSLVSALEHYEIGLRDIRRDQGFYGAQDRMTISLNALREITAYEKQLPGRKLVAWISPGWPLLSGVDVDLDWKQLQQIYAHIAECSTELREAGITLDSINSWGVGESVGRANYYEEFLKGVSRPEQAQIGNLGLQVLAAQSGGLVLNSTGVVDMLKQSVSDADDYYELTFAPTPSDKRNEYHRLQVEVQGSKVRTRESYYTQP